MENDMLNANRPNMTLKATGTTLAMAISAMAGHAETLSVPSSYASIQAALDAANPGDTVLVAPGSYAENLDFQGKAVTLRSTGGADATFLRPASSGAPVVHLRGPLSGQATFDGFTVSGGNASNGGAMFLSGNAVVSNSAFEDNNATFGGAAFVSGNARFSDVRFDENSSALGGALFAGPNASLTIERCDLTGNNADLGGALYANANSLGTGATLVMDSSFSGNSADKGGAVYSFMRDLSVEGSTLSQNDADSFGGAVAVDDAAAYFLNSSFDSNAAGGDGGAVGSMAYSALMAEGCEFTDNVATGMGGALYAPNSSAFDLLDSSLCGNSGPQHFGVNDLGGNSFDCTASACPADMNQDGHLSPADFGAWVDAFYARDMRADQNFDSFVSPTDFGAWLRNYYAGCP